MINLVVDFKMSKLQCCRERHHRIHVKHNISYDTRRLSISVISQESIISSTILLLVVYYIIVSSVHDKIEHVNDAFNFNCGFAESPSAESRDRVTTRSPEQHRPRYLTPPPQGTPLITKTHKTSHYRNRILCILDCITISLTYLAFGSSTRGSSRNVGLAIGVGVMCCCLKKLWRKLFAQQNEGDFGTPKIQQ